MTIKVFVDTKETETFLKDNFGGHTPLDIEKFCKENNLAFGQSDTYVEVYVSKDDECDTFIETDIELD